MNFHLRACTAIALLSLSTDAFACSWPYSTPEEKYQTNSAVVLAYPIGVLNQPSDALESTFQGAFRQRIQWQVLISWKGQYRPGDMFLTWISHQTGICGDQALRQRAVRLLYLSGPEPYKEVINVRPESSISEIEFLEGLRHDG
jgi:hypothetical protein